MAQWHEDHIEELEDQLKEATDKGATLDNCKRVAIAFAASVS